MKCKRKAWLDFQGDKSFKDWSPHTSIQLITANNNFNKFTKGELNSGLKSCEKGFRNIIGLKIKDRSNVDLNIEIFPPLMVKSIGKSKWGEFKYIAAVSKLGRKTTKEHLLELALCSIYIERLQESVIDYGLVISNFQNKLKIEKIFLSKILRKKATNYFHSLNESLKGSIPKITQDRKKCSICSWQKFCDKEAKLNGFLTDIDGIGYKTAKSLKKIGISNIKQLASADNFELSQKLSVFQETNSEKTIKFITQSKSYLTGIPLRINNHQVIENLNEKLASGFFVFDIESNPDENHDFLYGFLSIPNVSKPIKASNYEPILNLDNLNKEKKNIKKLFNKIYSSKHWPILHYGETEKISIINLAKSLNKDSYEIEHLSSRFLDLHFLVRANWILPLKNYNLKTVASWTGFNWNQKNVNGSKALFWWMQYKRTLNKSFLDKIIRYNHDDCLATLSIANWLRKNQI